MGKRGYGWGPAGPRGQPLRALIRPQDEGSRGRDLWRPGGFTLLKALISTGIGAWVLPVQFRGVRCLGGSSLGCSWGWRLGAGCPAVLGGLWAGASKEQGQLTGQPKALPQLSFLEKAAGWGL